jgi:phage recombination protein Bet
MKKETSLAVADVSAQQIAALNPDVVINDICRGNKLITKNEAMLFIAKCQAANLNPFLNEAYLIKYSVSEPAAMIISVEAFLKRAELNPRYKGMEFGTICIDAKGVLSDVEGSIIPPNHNCYGAWCRVYVDGNTVPSTARIMFSEYAQRKSNGQPNSFWANKPATMCVKVAKMQALRNAFPSDFGGVYIAEEQGITLQQKAIDAPEKQEAQTSEPAKIEEAKIIESAPEQPQGGSTTDIIRDLEVKAKAATTLKELYDVYSSHMPQAAEYKEFFAAQKERISQLETKQ